jgi:hypothetical protein
MAKRIGSLLLALVFTSSAFAQQQPEVTRVQPAPLTAAGSTEWMNVAQVGGVVHTLVYRATTAPGAISITIDCSQDGGVTVFSQLGTATTVAGDTITASGTCTHIRGRITSMTGAGRIVPTLITVAPTRTGGGTAVPGYFRAQDGDGTTLADVQAIVSAPSGNGLVTTGYARIVDGDGTDLMDVVEPGNSVTSSGVSGAVAVSLNYVYDGTNWHGMYRANAAHATTGGNLLGVGPLVWDGTNWVRQTSANIGFVGNSGSGISHVMGNAYNASTVDSFRNSSAAVLSAATQPYALQTAPPGMLTCTYATTSGAATGSCTVAAGTGGQRHVVTAIHASVACAATVQTPIGINLRDGASAAGTIKWSGMVGCPANSMGELSSPPLHIVMSAATQMVLEFEAATATDVVPHLTLQYYTTQ